MTIRDPEKFCESLWDWSCLKGCLGDGKIEPTDGDGLAFVERNSYFLLLETKLPKAEIPEGQHRLFLSFCNKNNCVVFVIWGKPGNPEKMKIYDCGSIYYKDPCDLDGLRSSVDKWYQLANSKG